MVASPIALPRRIFDVVPQNYIGASSFGILVLSFPFLFSYENLYTMSYISMIACILPSTICQRYYFFSSLKSKTMKHLFFYSEVTMEW